MTANEDEGWPIEEELVYSDQGKHERESQRHECVYMDAKDLSARMVEVALISPSYFHAQRSA